MKSDGVPLVSVFTTAVEGALPQRPWSLLSCVRWASDKAAAATVCMCVFMWDMLAPNCPFIFMCSLVSPNISSKGISCPKIRATRPKAQLWKLFIYSVRVWWRSHAASPNNRLSFWRRRHREREQQPEFIPLKNVYCRKVTRLHQSTGTHTSMHACKHTYIKTVLLFSTCWFTMFVLNSCFSH